MFHINKHTLRFYLKSGQIIKIKVRKYEIRHGTDGQIKGWSMSGCNVGETVSLAEVAAIVSSPPIWKSFISWIIN